jgi:cell division protein FtsQ
MEMSLPIALPLVRGRRLPLRAALTVLLGVLAPLGGWLWLRGSSLVSVQAVQVVGVRGAQAGAIEGALRSSARRMTTLDFQESALRSAVVAFPVVKGLRVSTSFPHGVRIEVLERPPVAVLQAAGERTAVAADGTALGTRLASSSLPVVDGSYAPIPGQRVGDEAVLEAAAVLGAAPPVLARLVVRIYSGSEGLTAQMRNGLLVYFGNSSRPHAKWLSLQSVLASPSAAGARYVDVRVPERPAAGTSSTEAAPSAGSSPPAATLAQRLEQTVGLGGAGGASTTSAGASGAGAEGPAGGGTGRGGEASAGSGVGAARGGAGEGASAAQGAESGTSESAAGTSESSGEASG